MDHTAREVLDLLKKKPYKPLVRDAQAGTILYPPQQGKAILELEHTKSDSKMNIAITDESTQIAAKRLTHEGQQDLVLLNFASGKNPGGGFIRGSKAQEEDLCRCSGLYPCLLTQPEYYRFNRSTAQGNPSYYSDHTIYSPDVPWFRTNSKSKPGDIFLASVITSPAPNLSNIKLIGNEAGEKWAKDEAEKVIRNRAGIILAIAEINQHRNLLLGAWGCGVFNNDPAIVADAFGLWLESSRFCHAFDNVTFAIYCPNEKDIPTLKAFQERFK